MLYGFSTHDKKIFFIIYIRALPLKEGGLRHSIESVVREIGLLFSALPFKFALK